MSGDVSRSVIPEEEVDLLLERSKELAAIVEKLDNEDVTQTIALMLRLVVNPEIPASVATPYIVKLEGMAGEFKLLGKYFMFMGKGEPDARIKKEMYMTLSERCEGLAAALKYVARVH